MRALHNDGPISRHFTLVFYALKKGMIKKNEQTSNSKTRTNNALGLYARVSKTSTQPMPQSLTC